MNRIVKRGLEVLLLVALAAGSLAPAALADRGHGRSRSGGPGPGYVRGYGGWRGSGHGPIFIERHSDAGPAIVGFLGGLVLGTVLSNAQPAPPPVPVYEYYDPYCHERFGSLRAYEQHLDYHDHPWAIDVIEARSGRYLDTYVWQDGRWTSGADRDEARGERGE
jgi:hypothetical protein